jgi:hypothetical protein
MISLYIIKAKYWQEHGIQPLKQSKNFIYLPSMITSCEAVENCPLEAGVQLAVC